MNAISTTNVTRHFDEIPGVYFTKIHLKARATKIKFSVKVADKYRNIFRSFLNNKHQNKINTESSLIIRLCLSIADGQLTEDIVDFMTTHMGGIIYPVNILKELKFSSAVLHRMHCLYSSGKCSEVGKGHRVYLEVAANALFKEICLKPIQGKKNYLRIMVDRYDWAVIKLLSGIPLVAYKTNQSKFLTDEPHKIQLLMEIALREKMITPLQLVKAYQLIDQVQPGAIKSVGLA